ncbi:MAG: type II toxin-antitoxin system prevent-host-death family antitoxin [Bryobacterales bacterium]|nr:type II toxin-antitoxin system prevent-host-death family antitoxin [Bryobacterales bacterium]
MPTETSYTNLREHLAKFLDQVTAQQEIIVVRRKEGQDVALIDARELEGLLETAHLLRAPKNAKRLLKGLRRAGQDKGKSKTVEQVRQEAGLA